MDETKLLEECVNIPLTPLQTILLSKTLRVTNKLLEFLQSSGCIVIEKYKVDEDVLLPAAEQTGQILIKSALTAMEEINEKIWENGSKEIGKEIPEEFNEVIASYSLVIEQIANDFIRLLQKEKDN